MQALELLARMFLNFSQPMLGARSPVLKPFQLGLKAPNCRFRFLKLLSETLRGANGTIRTFPCSLCRLLQHRECRFRSCQPRYLRLDRLQPKILKRWAAFTRFLDDGASVFE